MFDIVSFTNEPAAAAGLSVILSNGTGCSLSAVYQNLTDLQAALRDPPPQVLLLDMNPGITMRTILELRALAPQCRIVLWVGEISPPLAHQAVQNGVSGILTKSSPAETLVRCLEVVSQGGLWFEDSLERETAQFKSVALTPREGELVQLVSSGLMNKQIAAQMGLSEGTVKVYLCRLFRKLGVDSRFELALHGLRNEAQGGQNLWPASQSAPSQSKAGKGETMWLRSLVVSKRPQRCGSAVATHSAA